MYKFDNKKLTHLPIEDRIHSAAKEYREKVKGKMLTSYKMIDDRKLLAEEIAIKYNIKPKFFSYIMTVKR